MIGIYSKEVKLDQTTSRIRWKIKYFVSIIFVLETWHWCFLL